MNFEQIPIEDNDRDPIMDNKSEAKAELSAKDKLNSKLERIKKDGGIQGSEKFYPYKELQKKVDVALSNGAGYLLTITRNEGLREAVAEVILEKAKAERLSAKPKNAENVIPKKEPIDWSDEAEHLESLDKQDRARHP